MIDLNEDDSGEGRQAPRPDIEAPSTVGTGSVLGAGCIAMVVLLVIVALVVRWIAGGW